LCDSFLPALRLRAASQLTSCYKLSFRFVEVAVCDSDGVGSAGHDTAGAISWLWSSLEGFKIAPFFFVTVFER